MKEEENIDTFEYCDIVFNFIVFKNVHVRIMNCKIHGRR